MKLKEKEFLALGPGGKLAIRTLPAPALKLYLNLMLLADPETGCVDARYAELIELVDRCDNSLGKDFEELRRHGVCTTDVGSNQYKRVRVEICDRFWPYVKSQHVREPHLSGQGNAKMSGDESKDSRAESAAAPVHQTSISNTQTWPTNFSTEQQSAFSKLLDFGIAPEEAENLVENSAPAIIQDNLEYVTHLASAGSSHIRNPQGMLIYRLRERVPVPTSFATTRQREAQEAARRKEDDRIYRMQTLECTYQEWCRTRCETEMLRRFSGTELDRKISDMALSARQTDRQLARIPALGLRDIMRNVLIKEICAEMKLPTFEQWLEDRGELGVEGEA